MDETLKAYIKYYNEFNKVYTPKKFTQALYKATLNSDVLTFIVLDEMNLSRIEYYFSDFLSLMENEQMFLCCNIHFNFHMFSSSFDEIYYDIKDYSGDEVYRYAGKRFARL